MNVVLATAPETWLSKMYLPSLGLLYMAKSLETGGFQVAVVDSTIEGYQESQIDALVDAILAKDPAVVGFTGNSHNRFNVMKAVSLIRAKAPGVVTVVGGPHFGLSHVAEDTMRHTTDIDVVCVGEGEFALRDLCMAVQEKRDFSGIAGLLWKDKDRAIVTNKGNRQLPPDDLDLLGMPAWHLIDHTKFHSILEGGFEGTRSIGLKSTRGCPYACSFCCENAAMGRRNVRKRTPALFVDEIEHLMKEYGYNAFDFWDDTFTVMPKHAYAVCDEIIRRKLDIRWYARTTILSPHRDPNLFKRMREAGCVALGAGVESGNFEIQRKIHAEGKNVSCKVIKETVTYAASLGMRVKCFFIWGHPGETPKTLKETLNFMDELNNVNPLITATSGIMRIYPGTELETIARANGSIPADFSWTKYVEFPKSRMFCVDKTLPFFEDTMTIEEIKAIISQHSMQYMTPARKTRRIAQTVWKYARKIHSKEDLLHVGHLAKTFLKNSRLLPT